MTKRMLIDATHLEETRVAVLGHERLEDFDFESLAKKQVKGNIYLAKVIRVEPSLQAAFVDYGEGKHGFLAFSEIHPDYYRIPVSDRDGSSEGGLDEHDVKDLAQIFTATAVPPISSDDESDDEESVVDAAEEKFFEEQDEKKEQEETSVQAEIVALPQEEVLTAGVVSEVAALEDGEQAPKVPEAEKETVEADGAEFRSQISKQYRKYKIQEVIKRRQVMLVQVIKEERGNKGAALTTYISLAGRYCVLMPNAGEGGGGVSRKITDVKDRKRLKSIIDMLEIPQNMGVIVRTAGMERSKVEIKRDFEYLMRLWNDIRELTISSLAPSQIYEEGDLVKRAIRDLYSKEVDEILVEGEEGYKTAKNFMKMLMPSHAKRVKLYKDAHRPLFHSYRVEDQIDAIHNPVVQLKAGGYIIFSQTEALVAIDVNSGRSTRERHIEETALKTNLEAADEIAIQLRLRDLAGLVVIDFIDMEDHRHIASVERRLKEALRNDRARIQVGRISNFGLMELSRQRLRPSIMEVITQTCPHCRGSGHIRSIESTALSLLRSIEDEGIKQRGGEVFVYAPAAVGFYVFNNKRDHLANIEARHDIKVIILSDERLIGHEYRVDRKRLAPQQNPNPKPERPKLNNESAHKDQRHSKNRDNRDNRDHRRDAADKDKKETSSEESLPKEVTQVSNDGDEKRSEESRSSRRRRRGKRGGKRHQQKVNGENQEQENQSADLKDTLKEERQEPKELKEPKQASSESNEALGQNAEKTEGSDNNRRGRNRFNRHRRRHRGPRTDNGEGNAGMREVAGEAKSDFPKNTEEKPQRRVDSDQKKPEVSQNQTPSPAPVAPAAQGEGAPSKRGRKGWWQRLLE